MRFAVSRATRRTAIDICQPKCIIALIHLAGDDALFILKPHSGVPIYRQLLDQIRRMAASGQLPPGTELPSIRDLALQHAINPMTVSKVYTLLEAEGVLERNRGKPMTVATADARAVAARASGSSSSSRTSSRSRSRRASSSSPRKTPSKPYTMLGRRPMSSPYIAARGLGKSFSGKPVLADVSFTVEPGDVVGVLGKNGAGKTTLLELVLGFTPATAGGVQLFGYDSYRLPGAAKARIGFVPQQDELVNQLTAADQIGVIASFYPQVGRRARRVA